MRTITSFSAIIVASGFCATASSSFGNVVNGSFESAQLPGPDRVAIGNLTDWTASGGLTLLERGVNGVSSIAAHSGEQFVSMGHNGAQGDTLSQVVPTVIGTTYTVSFYIHCIQGNSLQTVTASAVSGNVLGSVDASVSSITQGWVNYNFTFEASAPQTELRFVHTLGSNDANVAIDSVTVVPAPGGVAAVAFGVLGLTARRRRA